MTTSPREALAHPLVRAYINSLEAALAGADALEREDTISAVKEHLAEALDGNATGDQVREVLTELGPVEQIAAAATPAPRAADVGAKDQWVPPALLIASIVSVFIPFVGGAIAIVCLVIAIALLRKGHGQRPLLGASIAISVVALVVTAVVVLGALAVTSMRTDVTRESSAPVVTVVP